MGERLWERVRVRERVRESEVEIVRERECGREWERVIVSDNRWCNERGRCVGVQQCTHI